MLARPLMSYRLADLASSLRPHLGSDQQRSSTTLLLDIDINVYFDYNVELGDLLGFSTPLTDD